MPETFVSRLRSAWNAFKNRDAPGTYRYVGPGSGDKPDRVRYRQGNEKSIIASVWTKIALDVASIPIEHVRLNKDGEYDETLKTSLNNCFSVEANKDQSGMALIQDTVMSMFDEGVVAVVPIDTVGDPSTSNSYEIETLRVGKIVNWFPDDVTVQIYNDRTGLTEQITLPKRVVAIVENPFFTTMNAHGSTLKRLIHKLNLLDAIDEQSGSGKLDLIIQLPFATRNDERKKNAERRRSDLRDQLKDSQYGVAYADASEKIIQLNRPVENNLMKQIEFLTAMFYSQLGTNNSVFDGTATNEVMTNYYTRTVEVILSVIVLEFRRKFLSRTARDAGESIMYFRNPFRFISATVFADIADKLTRNEIATPNNIRREIGWKPSKDPNADVLKNRNIAAAKGSGGALPAQDETSQTGGE